MKRFALFSSFVVATALVCGGGAVGASGTSGASHACAAPQVEVTVSKQLVRLGSGQYYIHTVKRGETLYSISRAYGVSQEVIEARNPFVAKGLSVKQTLLIPVVSSTNFNSHTSATSTGPSSSSTTTSASATSATSSAPLSISSSSVDSVDSIADGGNVVVESDEAFFSKAENRMLAPFNAARGVNVGLFLPFSATSGTGANENFADFYRGALIALGMLREEGVNANLRVMSSEHGVDTAALARASENFQVIIGPVYEAHAGPVVEFAERNKVAVVSPLAEFKALNSPFLFQAAPDKAYKWDKLYGMLSADTANVVVIREAGASGHEILGALDSFFASSFSSTAVSRSGVKYVEYSKNSTAQDITAALSLGGANLVIVAIDNQAVVEQVLSRISSVNTTGRYDLVVFGSSTWGRFSNINLDLYFKLGVRYISSYHADRGEVAVSNFYNRYIAAYNALPTLFSFRGYDVIRYFVGAVAMYGPRMPLMVGERYNPDLLQVKYGYVQQSVCDTHKNREWVMVCYKPNYTIEVL